MTVVHPNSPTPVGVEALLASYVAGTLSAPLNVLCAAHLEMSPLNRGYVRALEAAAGVALAEGPLAPVTGRDAKLAAIFAMDKAPPRPAPVRRPRGNDVFPGALQRFIGKSLAEVTWKRSVPGVREYRVAETDGGEVSLYWITAGRKLPTHTHEGSEITLVLQGGFTDVLGSYLRGDIAIADQDVDHRPVADDDGEDCLCFAVTDAPLVLTGAVGRWLEPFRRH